MDIVMQGTLFGGMAPADAIEGIKHLLQEYPETRNSYPRLVARYWLEIDGLAALLVRGMTPDEFVAWMDTCATSAKTIQNRCGEIQNEYPDLEADPAVEARRQIQARAGIIK